MEDRSNHIEKLPKAELHLHLEGSATAGAIKTLSRKYDTEYAALSEGEISKALFQYSDFMEFLGTYKKVCELLRDTDDYVMLLRRLEGYLVSQNILYAEIIYTPSVPWKFGRDGKEILEALTEEASRFERDSGVRIRWILDCVRQFEVGLAERTAELAVQFAAAGVVAVGLGGDEKAGSLERFEETFNWVRAHQLFVHVHAGEIGDPSKVWEALQAVGANRIGHGIQAARDGKLMNYLKDHAIGLDVCLTSNARTRAWPLISSHPFPVLFKRGVPVTLNTDDPGLFETTLNMEYKRAFDAFHLGEDELNRLSLQGIRSSFLPHEEKMQMMQMFQERIRQLQ